MTESITIEASEAERKVIVRSTKDHGEHDRQDELERLAGVDLELVLARPLQRDARRKPDPLGHAPLRRVDEADQVRGLGVHVDDRRETPLLVLVHGGPVAIRIAASLPMGTWAPKGVMTRTRRRVSMSLRKSRG